MKNLSNAPEQPSLEQSGAPPEFSWKLWVYTNYDCNLQCTYCVARSGPTAPRRGLGLDTVRRLVDEAVELGFRQIFLTGGEPFILPDIYEMLAYASTRLPATVLTNGMLLQRSRLEKLRAVANGNLTVQVSLDGGRPEEHDNYRGQGSWAKTVAGIQTLLDHGFHVRLSTTETPANSAHLARLYEFRQSLGIPEKDHFIRPMARRGFARDGLEVGVHNLVPELTVTVDGVFWHPLAAPGDTDMQVSRDIFPLTAAVACVQRQLDRMAQTGDSTLKPFT